MAVEQKLCRSCSVAMQNYAEAYHAFEQYLLDALVSLRDKPNECPEESSDRRHELRPNRSPLAETTLNQNTKVSDFVRYLMHQH